MRNCINTGLGCVAILLAAPLHLAAQSQAAALLAADRAASALSSDSGLATLLAGKLDSVGVLLWPGAPVVVGPAEAGRLLAMIPAARDSTRLNWQPLSATVARDSSLGVTWGIAVVTPRFFPGPPQFGRYMAAWRRHTDQWGIEAILFAGVKPAATALLKGTPLARSPATPSGVSAQFVSADIAFARLAGDSGAGVAFRRWAAPDAMVFGEYGLLTRGPEAIGLGVTGPELWRWRPVSAGAARSGDLGWTAGEAVITPREGAAIYSKYLTIWVRHGGGPARFLTDGGNARPASP